MKICEMKVILFIVLVISVVANGEFLRFYDRRVLLEPGANKPAASGATVFDISKSAGAKGNGQTDMTAVSIQH